MTSVTISPFALATGNHIFFQTGKFNPDSSSGFELLAHETAHTIQQDKVLVSAGIDSSPSLEASAVLEGQKAVVNKSVLEQNSNTLRDFMGFPKPLEPKESTSPISVKNVQRSLENLSVIQRLQTSKSWRETGNLKGNPPVRDEKNPPNKNIVEDEKTYSGLLSSVRAVHKKQIARAASMTSKNGFIKDYRYWFTKVYGFVTQNEMTFAKEKSFYYPSAVLLEVLYFDKLYEDNLNAGVAKQEVHWRESFKTIEKLAAEGDDLPTNAGEIIFSLISSMLAHIRFDLPRALSWVIQDYQRKFGAKPTDLQSDFFSMSGVFDLATQQMIPIMISQLLKQKESLGTAAIIVANEKNLMDFGMRYALGADMSLERLEAWQRTQALLASGQSVNPYILTADNQLQGNVTSTNNQKLIQQTKPSMSGITSTTTSRVATGIAGVAAGTILVRSEEQIIVWLFAMRNPKEAKKYDTLSRAKIILELLKVPGVSNRTPELILEILKVAKIAGDLAIMVDAVGVAELLGLLQGEYRAKGTTFLLKNYFAITALNTIVFQILKWVKIHGIGDLDIRFIRNILKTRSTEDNEKIREQLVKYGQNQLIAKL
jgi:hypothetical protein